MRDQAWLQGQLDFLLKNYFSNVSMSNPIVIGFGREARFRFGSIRLEKPRGLRVLRGLRSLKSIKEHQPIKSIITVTSMFARDDIPVDVVRYTIAHELCHYAHGFSSTNKRMFKHPHHGGVINKELKSRGAEHLSLAFKVWLKDYRAQILAGRTRLF
ncbi:MAG TPA: hypothetical protein VLE91_03015 [Candidatus Saccharimonadales bacterium]|nr:hypothetical protein [Candidatus Saccharimonadales bacterium]